jgi:hypothetical protein
MFLQVVKIKHFPRPQALLTEPDRDGTLKNSKKRLGLCRPETGHVCYPVFLLVSRNFIGMNKFKQERHLLDQSY